MNDNVTVYCRLRSSDYSYLTIDPDATHLTVDVPASGKAEVSPSSKNSQRVFALDRVFTVDSSQDEIFQECAAPLVNSFLQGYNCAFMAYGGTGSGKTYTMMGVPNSQTLMGIIPRAMEQIWRSQKEGVTVSFVEIYEEYVYDLLVPGKGKHLKIVDDLNNMKVQGCKELPFTNAKEMQKKLEIAFDNRTKAATNMNAESSRSHAIVIVTCNNASLFLVDLAGAEDQADTQSTGKVLKQASAINKSLSELTNVMNALYQKQRFVNYRNSKLTTLLKKALGGNSMTRFMLTCNPVPKQLSMNLRTLQFGNRARSMENDAKVIAPTDVDWHMKYEEAMAKLEEHNRTIAALQSQLLETSTDKENEEKKNLDANHQTVATTNRFQRRPSVMASVLEDTDKAHLEDLLETDHHGITSTSSDSDSDSCPALILTEAALQRMSRPSIISQQLIDASRTISVSEIIDDASKTTDIPVNASKPPIPEEVPSEVIVPEEVPKEVPEEIPRMMRSLSDNVSLLHEYRSLEDSNYDLEVRLHELEQSQKKTSTIHYPVTIWGQVGLYISIVVILVAIIMVYVAHRDSTPQHRGYLHIGIAWTSLLGGLGSIVACLYN
jgi:hypothetical protein